MKRSEVVTITSVVLAGLLTVAGHIFVREWYAPDLRYETGEFYRTSTSWITALRLENHGRESAEDVVVSVAFPTGIHEYSIGSAGVEIAADWDGPGSTSLNLRVPHVAPSQVVLIYFDIAPLEDPSTDEVANYVRSIISDSGPAEEGPPRRPIWLAVLLSGLIGGFIGLVTAHLSSRWVQPEIDSLKGDFRGIHGRLGEITGEIDRLGFAHTTIDRIADYVEGLQDAGEEVPERLLGILKTYRQRVASMDDHEADEEH